jgi:hypothetical protein
MAVRTTLIILGLVSLCVAQDAAEASIASPSAEVEEAPAVVAEEPVKAAPAVKAAPPAKAAAVPKPAAPAAVDRKLEDTKTLVTVMGMKTKYVILEQGDKDRDTIEVGDTPHCHLEAYVMGNNTPFFDTHEEAMLGGLGSLNWFAGESENLAGPDDVPPAKDFGAAKTKKINGRIPKGIDKGMMGARWFEKRELHIPADELFGSGASSKIPSATEYKLVLWISKIKHKGQEAKEYRRLAPQRAEEARKVEEARRLGLATPAKEAPAAKSSSSSTISSKAATKETQDLKKSEEM